MLEKKLKDFEKIIENNEISLEDAYITAYEAMNKLEKIIEKLKPKILEKVKENGKIEYNDYEIIKKVIVKYDYSGCKTIEDLENELARARELAKNCGVHPDTGEILFCSKKEIETITLKKIKK